MLLMNCFYVDTLDTQDQKVSPCNNRIDTYNPPVVFPALPLNPRILKREALKQVAVAERGSGACEEVPEEYFTYANREIIMLRSTRCT